MFLVGAIIQLGYERFEVSELNSLLISYGLLIITVQVVTNIWTADFQRLPSEVNPFSTESVAVGSLRFPMPTLLAAGWAIVLVIGAALILERTYAGRALQAFGQDRQIASAFGIDHRRLHYATVHQNLADRQCDLIAQCGLHAQTVAQLLFGERAAADQDFTQAHVLFRQRADHVDVVENAAAWRQDVNLRVVAHEFEHAFDGGFVLIALEADLETQVAALRVHLRRGWQRRRHRIDGDDFAQRLEETEEGQRVHAVAQHVAAETQRDVPIVGGHRIAAERLDGFVAQRRHRRGDLMAVVEVEIEALDQALAGMRRG